MRVLIANDNEVIAMEDNVEIVMLMRNPATIPALAVYPRGANVGAWHSIHDEAMEERKRQAMDNERTVTDR